MTQSAGQVFVVDDNPEMRTLIMSYLGGEGFAVTGFADGHALRCALTTDPRPDVIIVDLGLPGEDGLSLTRFLRAHHDVGILIASGKGDTVDRVIGLEVGADDYLAKPFDLRELLARVRSLIRRSRPVPEEDLAPEKGHADDVRVFAGWRLDLRARHLSAPDGKRVNLSTGEFNLLREFVLAPNHVLSRDDLMERLHGRTAGPYDRSIDVQVSRLRRKIEINPEDPDLIKSVRGVGYVFTPAVDRA